MYDSFLKSSATKLFLRSFGTRTTTSKCISTVGRIPTNIRMYSPIISLASSSSISSSSILTNKLFMKQSFSSKAQNELSSKITRELKEEKENSSDVIPDDLAELKQSLSKHWTIIDGASTTASGSGDSSAASVRMFKNEAIRGGGKVTITFHCQDTDDMGGDGGLFENVDGNEEELSAPVKFEVTVSRANTTMKMVCVSEDAAAIVENVIVYPSDTTLDESEFYRGPDLDDLPEDVRGALDDYVQQVCGVDEDVASFIAMYADYREQAEYVKWLQGIKKVIE